MADTIPPPPPGFTLVAPGGTTAPPAPPPGFTQQPQAGQTVELRRPQPTAPTGPGFTVDVLGRQYVVDAPSQEVADRAAAAVAARLGNAAPPAGAPNWTGAGPAPQVPTGDHPMERANPTTPEQDFDTAAIDQLGRELWTQGRADRPFVSKVGDWTRQLLEGVTLGGGGELVAGIDALIPGGMNYNERLAWEDQQRAAFGAENPVGAMATEIAGGLPWLRSPGALPRRGQSFGTNVARSTANAATIGTAYGALGTEGGLEERAQGAFGGAAMGAGVGAAIPTLGRLISPAVNLARASLPNADRTLVRALQESGTTGPDAAAALRRNPALNLADIDPNAMSLAQGIATQPGEGRSIISNAVNLRRADAPNRVTGIFDQSMGPAPDVFNTLDTMKTTANTNAAQGFGQALGGAGAVDLSRVVSSLESRLFPGGVRPQNWRPNTPADQEAASVLERLTQGGTGLITDPRTLHAIQSQMRTDATALLASSTGTDRRIGGVLRDIRRDIVDAIDEAARPVRQQSGGGFFRGTNPGQELLAPAERGNYGPGYYLSRQNGVAGMYGPEVTEYAVNGNLFNATSRFSPEDYASFEQQVFDQLSPAEASRVREWWPQGNAMSNGFNAVSNGEDAWQILSRRLGPERAQDILRSLGYDGIDGIGDGAETVIFRETVEGTTGPYRAAQAQYATDMQVQDAFTRGREVLRNPTAGDAALDADPSFWREWVNDLTPDELEAARLGARSAINTAIESVRNGTARGAAVTDVGFNYDRLVLLFGREEADRMAALLADEQTMAQSATRLLDGSQTQMRRSGAEATAVRPASSFGSAGGTGVLGVAAGYMAGQGQLLPAIALGAAGAVNTGGRALGRLMDKKRNAELARIIMASGPEAQARLGALIGPTSLQALMRPNRLVEMGLAPARTAVPATTN